MRKVAPSLWGGKSSRPGLNGAGRSLEESRCRLSVLEQRNATSLNFHPVCCNDVAWSIPPPHHHHHHHPHRQSTQRRFWKEQKKTPTLFFLCPSLSPAPTFSFSTHSLRVLSTPPLFLWRGVVFRSPPATRGRPRWPTEGGRGRGTERPLVAKDRLCFWKLTFPASPTASWENKIVLIFTILHW